MKNYSIEDLKSELVNFLKMKCDNEEIGINAIAELLAFISYLSEDKEVQDEYL